MGYGNQTTHLFGRQKHVRVELKDGFPLCLDESYSLAHYRISVQAIAFRPRSNHRQAGLNCNGIPGTIYLFYAVMYPPACRLSPSDDSRPVVG